MFKRFSKIFALAVVAAGLGGCTIGVGNSSQTVDTTNAGGVFKSVDGGLKWRQQGLLAAVNQKQPNFFPADSLFLALDPSDRQAVYFGSSDGGLFFSYDGGGSWRLARALGQRQVGDLAVDPKNKCQLYAASLQKIFKSSDCSRTWQEIYSDNEATALINSLLVDRYNPSIVYFGNSRGDVIKSSDGGKSWRTLKNFGDSIKKLVLDPADSRILLAGTDRHGLFISRDSGNNWLDLKESLQTAKAGKALKDVVPVPSQRGGYLLAVDDGLFKTVNYGQDWTELKLLPPEGRSDIRVVAVSAKNPQKIYYLTKTTFASTVDGGQNWLSHRLPTPRFGSTLLIDPADDNIIYLGVKQK